MIPTPTAFTQFMQQNPPSYSPPALSIWQFTDEAIQIWNTSQSVALILQVILLLALIGLGVYMVMGFIRGLSNEESMDEE